MTRQKELRYKVPDRGHYSNDYAQLGKDEVTIIFLFKCTLSFHYVPCSLIVQTYIYIDIYRYIYMTEIFSTTDDVFVLLLD